MLSKLIKHELRCTSRVMLPLYLAILLLAAFSNLSTHILGQEKSFFLSALAFIFLALFFLSLIAICVISVVLTIQRFYKNLLTDEGYLMFALPVSVHQHIWAKLLISALWIIGSVLVCALSIGLMTLRAGMAAGIFRQVVNFFQQLFGFYGLNVAITTLLVLILIVLSLFTSILLCYAAMAVGQSFSNHKFLLSVVFYFVFNIALQLLAVLGLALGVPFFASHTILTWLSGLSAEQTVNTTLLLLSFITFLTGGGFYWLTQHMLRRHLNLQ